MIYYDIIEYEETPYGGMPKIAILLEEEYSIIKSACFMNRWKAWKYFCKTEPVTKKQLINDFKE